MDAKLLRHILGNLLSNAIKYSVADKKVYFSIKGSPEHLTFTVQDQGIGIPQAEQAHLFETFHRAQNAKNIPGTGLGLAIVKQSVDLHGGTISFESEEGKGTTFTVCLPDAHS
jgi:signal transduction histidine kinase